MGEGTGDPVRADPGHAEGAPAAEPGSGLATPDALAAQAAETTRMEGVLVDDFLDATGYGPRSAAEAGTPVDAGARAQFVLDVLDSEASALPLVPGEEPTTQPASTGPAPASAAPAAPPPPATTPEATPAATPGGAVDPSAPEAATTGSAAADAAAAFSPGYYVTPTFAVTPPDPDPLGTALDQLSGDLASAAEHQATAAVVREDAAAWETTSAQHVADGVAAGIVGEQPPPGPEPPPWVSGPTKGDELRTLAAMTVNTPEALADRPEPGAGFGARHSYNLAIGGMAVVALAAFIGAILFLGGSGGSPSTSPGPSGAAVVASPSSGSTPAVSPVVTDQATPEPSTAATPAPTAVATAAPQSVTLRGPIDVKAMTKAGLVMGQHDAELVVFLDNDTVRGSFILAVEKFPIGELMAAMDKGITGSNDPDYEAFKACTVRLVLEAPITGTRNAKTGKLSGKATFRPTSEDVNDCLRTRPSNLTIDPNDAVEPTTVKWSATFDGTTAKGSIALDPAVAFTATVEE